MTPRTSLVRPFCVPPADGGRLVTLCLAALWLYAASPLCGASNDDLARPASWQTPAAAQTRDTVLTWIDTQPVDETIKQQLRERWDSSVELTGEQVLHRMMESLAVADPRIDQLVTLCREPRPAHELPEIAVAGDTSLPGWITANLRLYYGSWLAQQQLYDEAAEVLADLQPNDVVDPAALLFFQSVAAHRRLEKDRCLTTLDKLLENEASLPRRYVTVAKLMQSDLAPLRPDSLDEVSRLMDNIQIRLGHGRAGTRVRREEADVIAKLDKMIEQLEEQAQSMGLGAAGGGSNAPAAPMDDSMPAGGSGPGNVTPKQFGSRTDWGNLPPKQREEALQQISKDLPSHYRDVIEEYFRKLAREQK